MRGLRIPDVPTHIADRRVDMPVTASRSSLPSRSASKKTQPKPRLFARTLSDARFHSEVH